MYYISVFSNKTYIYTFEMKIPKLENKREKDKRIYLAIPKDFRMLIVRRSRSGKTN